MDEANSHCKRVIQQVVRNNEKKNFILIVFIFER